MSGRVTYLCNTLVIIFSYLSTVVDLEKVTFCEDESPVTDYVGSIVSPKYDTGRELNCSLRIVMPPYSGARLELIEVKFARNCGYENTRGLSLSEEYLSSPASYIKLWDDRITSRVCAGSRGGYVFYNPQPNPRFLHMLFYAENFTNQDSFNFTYEVVNVVDVGDHVPFHQLNVSGNYYGSIFSHVNNDLVLGNNYRTDINSTLTLVGLPSNDLQIQFELLDFEFGRCNDALIISGLVQEDQYFCAGHSVRLFEWRNLTTIGYNITFRFTSDGSDDRGRGYSGFGFKYRALGEPMPELLSATETDMNQNQTPSTVTFTNTTAATGWIAPVVSVLAVLLAAAIVIVVVVVLRGKRSRKRKEKSDTDQGGSAQPLAGDQSIPREAERSSGIYEEIVDGEDGYYSYAIDRGALPASMTAKEEVSRTSSYADILPHQERKNHRYVSHVETATEETNDKTSPEVSSSDYVNIIASAPKVVYVLNAVEAETDLCGDEEAPEIIDES